MSEASDENVFSVSADQDHGRRDGPWPGLFQPPVTHLPVGTASGNDLIVGDNGQAAFTRKLGLVGA
jgi:hypothetical protein